MAADKPSKPVKEKGVVETITDKLSEWAKGNPYSSASGGERMKKQLNPEDAPAAPAPDKQSSSYKQYMHEKSVGGPSTGNYEAWKKLG